MKTTKERILEIFEIDINPFLMNEDQYLNFLADEIIKVINAEKHIEDYNKWIKSSARIDVLSTPGGLHFYESETENKIKNPYKDKGFWTPEFAKDAEQKLKEKCEEPGFILNFEKGDKVTIVPTYNPWISIKDSQPEQDEDIVVTDGKGNYMVGKISSKGHLNGVTHYMNLTKPQ